MEAQSVLVEREDKIENTVFGCSGLMLNHKYIITTANIVLAGNKKNMFESLKPSKLYSGVFSSYNAPLNVVWIENGLYVVKRACIFSAFISENIKNSNKYIFQNWAINSIDNNRDLNKSLSVFFILAFEKIDCVEDFKNTLSKWWYLVGSFDINKGDTIFTKSSPFGNRNFINSFTKGIVSNIFGNNYCFILSDCPSTPGTEGSPVYLTNRNNLKFEVPIGLVLSSLSWWKGEWVGLTLLVDIRPIILELIDIPIRIYNPVKRMDNRMIISTTEFSLIQVYCGNNWGTAILLNEEKGIFVTNSHVIIEDINIFGVLRNKTCHMDLVYRTSENYVFDLAIIKCEPNSIKELNLKPIHISKKNCKTGDSVYSAGFSLFSKECQPSPTISKGCISQNNPYMLRTTCCVHPGASGGAILDDDGALLGIIVCNTKLHEHNTVYPRVNMAIPFSAVEKVIFKYIQNGDVLVLDKLNMKNKEAEIIWKRLEAKL